jgi:hypothetical protein
MQRSDRHRGIPRVASFQAEETPLAEIKQNLVIAAMSVKKGGRQNFGRLRLDMFGYFLID